MNQLPNRTKSPARLVSERVESGQLLMVSVPVELPLEIAQDDISIVASDEVFGLQRDFPASTGSINDISGNGVAGGMATQTSDERDALFDTGAEVVRPRDRITLIQIIGGAHASSIGGASRV